MSINLTYNGPHDLEKIYEDFISSNNGNPRVLSVAGGSCAGKSTLIENYFLKKFGNDIAVLNQDNFQMGEDFPLKDTSPWKWDDPLHFAPEDCRHALLELKKGNDIEIPVFSLKENRRVGTKKISASKYVLFDGLYSLRDGLEDLADVSIYVEAPFYARFLRRIFRYTYETQTGPAEVPVRLMLEAVYPAHQEFVKPQREIADYVVSTSYSFEETLSKFDANAIHLDSPRGEKVYSYKGEEDVEIAVFRENAELLLAVLYKGNLLQQAKINDTLFQAISVIDFNST